MNDVGGARPRFDAYAQSYDALLDQSIRASGESKQYLLDYDLEPARSDGPSRRMPS